MATGSFAATWHPWSGRRHRPQGPARSNSTPVRWRCLQVADRDTDPHRGRSGRPGLNRMLDNVEGALRPDTRARCGCVSSWRTRRTNCVRRSPASVGMPRLSRRRDRPRPRERQPCHRPRRVRALRMQGLVGTSCSWRDWTRADPSNASRSMSPCSPWTSCPTPTPRPPTTVGNSTSPDEARRGTRRSSSSASGPGQPARQRPHPHPGRHDRGHAHPAGGSARAHRRRGQRAGDTRGPATARLRALHPR